MSPRPAPAVTQRSQAFVEAHLDQARGLGVDLAGLLDAPDAFIASVEEGFSALGDSAYESEARRIIPGLGPMLGVRGPLYAAVLRGIRPALRRTSPAESLSMAQRLVASRTWEVRSLAHEFIRRSIGTDPERAWQLIRQLARDATSWVEIDVLAGNVALGILNEPYRWAELEQAVYSTNRWERRLVGSTLATIPHGVPPAIRRQLADSPALDLLASLIGDAEPDVQKSLSWALRTWVAVDPEGVFAFLEREAALAAATNDGHRTWVIRDSLSAQPAERSQPLREQLAGVRRHQGAPDTSRARQVAAAFLGPSTAAPARGSEVT